MRMLKSKEKKGAHGSKLTAEDNDSDAKIMKKLSSIQVRIQNEFSKIDNDIGVLKNELKGEVQAVKVELSEATMSLTAARAEVQSLNRRTRLYRSSATAP